MSNYTVEKYYYHLCVRIKCCQREVSLWLQVGPDPHVPPSHFQLCFSFLLGGPVEHGERGRPRPGRVGQHVCPQQFQARAPGSQAGTGGVGGEHHGIWLVRRGLHCHAAFIMLPSASSIKHTGNQVYRWPLHVCLIFNWQLRPTTSWRWSRGH